MELFRMESKVRRIDANQLIFINGRQGLCV